MPGPQSAVLFTQASGIPGEWAYDGPSRVFPWTLFSNGVPNVIGATAFTIVAEGLAMAGGAGPFAGILVDPKAAVNFGFGNAPGGAFAPTMTLADNAIGELAVTGIPFVVSQTAGNPGDYVMFNIATGAISSLGATLTFAGSSAGTVLTVTGTPSGIIAPGLALGAPFLPGTIVVSNGTGTGAAGTYNLNVANTVAAGNYGSSGVPSVPPGYTRIAGARFILRSFAAGGLAILELAD